MGILGRVPSNDETVIRRAFEYFNRLLEPEIDAEREAIAELWHPELELVPMRAALEGTSYRGPDAIDRFREASLESWSELEVEIEEISRPGERWLISGTLRGRGRESGAEITVPMWFVAEVRDGRIARLAAHLDRARALAELE